MFELDTPAPRADRNPIPLSAIDAALTAQIVVAWAGEGGEEKRLGWWRSDLVAEFGGEDLFLHLLPSTWAWAVLQAAREVARRKDAELRRKAHDPDRILSLFSLGFEVDERVEERFQDLKRTGQAPEDALPGLRDVIRVTWNADRFADWARVEDGVKTTPTPIGRQVQGPLPANLDRLVRSLVGALVPLPDTYPLPHFRRPK